MDEGSPEEQVGTVLPAERIQSAGRALADLRGRPCWVLVTAAMCRSLLVPLRASLPRIRGDEIDVVLCSHGGSLEAAYMLVRALRERFRHLAVFVPLCAKSAATAVCLGADELVLGEMGELGPLDAQIDDRNAADGRQSVSCLTSIRILRELNECALSILDESRRRIAEATGVRALDALDRASDLATGLMAPAYGRVDPVRLSDDARALDVSTEYALRILRRWRSEIPEEAARPLVNRLVYGYAAHGFVIDRLELSELGLPWRAPTAAESPHVEAIADALIECDEQVEVRDVFHPRVRPGIDGPRTAGAGHDGALRASPS